MLYGSRAVGRSGGQRAGRQGREMGRHIGPGAIGHARTQADMGHANAAAAQACAHLPEPCARGGVLQQEARQCGQVLWGTRLEAVQHSIHDALLLAGHKEAKQVFTGCNAYASRRTCSHADPSANTEGGIQVSTCTQGSDMSNR